MADETVRPIWNVNRFPPIIFEAGASESIEKLDGDAQFWLSPLSAGDVAGVLIVRIFKPRPTPSPAGAASGPFAAFAAFYEAGNTVAPAGAPARTVNEALVIPGAPIGGPAIAPVIPTWACSFGTATLNQGRALDHAIGLGVLPTGVGFGGPACNAPGIAAYTFHLPAARIYHGTPAANLPPGFPVAPGPGLSLPAGPNVNDMLLDLYEFIFVLENAVEFK
jgi:hypothetical protein